MVRLVIVFGCGFVFEGSCEIKVTGGVVVEQGLCLSGIVALSADQDAGCSCGLLESLELS
jgi:hypothetical protein